jgi:polyphosphate kinase
VSTRRKKVTELPVAPAEGPTDLHNPDLYVNRELSLLAFQRRVLEEAQDEHNPLLERVKFLSIVGSNLDEFFMVRVAGLQAQVEAGTLDVGPDGMSPAAQLVAIRREVKKIYTEAQKCWRDQLQPALAADDIYVRDYGDLNEREREIADTFFRETVYPVLTPLAYDPGRPFPHISNLSLNLAITVCDDKGVAKFARIKVPPTLPQFVPLLKPLKKGKHKQRREASLVWLEQVIAANVRDLFPGMEIRAVHPFHVTRDADLAIKELEAEDLLETVEEGVRQRRFGSVVRLTVTDEMPDEMLEILTTNLELDPSQVFKVRGPLALSRFMHLYKLERPDLKDGAFVPAMPEALHQADDEDIFAAIRRQDVLLHHPFDSFHPVVDLVRKAAHDPHVLAIKITLYRVGRNSPIVDALLEAMENDKQVAVLVELKARFDEESNIEWARALEREGVHVVYGLLGLKIHCKTLMVVRREGDAIRRYIHIGTGNYNAVTAHLYTDMGLFTASEPVAQDVTDLFNYLTGYSAKNDYAGLLVAPVNMRQRLEALIRREMQTGQGHLIFKMNALTDAFMIRLLYEASQAGVRIELLVRGVCALRPGLRGISDNITVTSIVGRFLEHSRVYCFRNAGEEEIYIGSADLMNRNLSRRVEALVKVAHPDHVRQLKDTLALYLADNVKARVMGPDGTYSRKQADAQPLNAQEYLVTRARAAKFKAT